MAMINCPECGKEISDQAKVCPNCGVSISKKKGGSAVIILLVILIVIIIVAAGLTIFYLNKNADSKDLAVNVENDIDITEDTETIIETEGLLFQREYYDKVNDSINVLYSGAKNHESFKLNGVVCLLGGDFKNPIVHVSFSAMNSYGAIVDEYYRVFTKYLPNTGIALESSDYDSFEGAKKQATGQLKGSHDEILEGVWAEILDDGEVLNKAFVLNVDDFNQIMGTDY